MHNTTEITSTPSSVTSANHAVLQIRIHMPDAATSTSVSINSLSLPQTVHENTTVHKWKHTTTCNTHAGTPRTSPNVPTIILIMQVLQYNIAIQALTWIQRDYQAYTYAYDTHIFSRIMQQTATHAAIDEPYQYN